MKQIAKSICLISMLAASLTACKTTPVKPATPLPADMAPTTYIIPASKDLVMVNNGLIKDINFEGFSSGSENSRNSLRFHENSQNSFIVHRRIDNGMAGSGIKYLVNYSMKQENEGYSVTLKPSQSTAYQEGLIGKFDVPPFTPTELQNAIRTGLVYFEFEIDSEYGVKSVITNFKRLSTPAVGHYYITNRDQKVRFSFNATPYRDGSKVIIKVVIPAAETSKNTFDFGILEKEIKAKLIAIVKA
jgi:hypothetical protein